MPTAPDDPSGTTVSNQISGGVFFRTVIQGRDITVNLPHEVPPALSGLPMGSPAFVGRHGELATLLQVLNPASDEGTPTLAVVSGLAGVGKTEIALQAAHEALRRGWYPGGALFVDLYGYDPARQVTSAAALDGFLRALGIPGEHIPPEAQDRARLYSSVLALLAEEGRRVLVVVDNAFSADNARPLLPATGAVITSRHTMATLNARLIDLESLPPPDAQGLLEQAIRLARPADTRVAESPREAQEVAALCGHLPLALRIVAALLARLPTQSLAKTAARLHEERTRLDELIVESWAVRAAFDLSFQHLEPEQAQVFALLALSPGPDIATDAAAILSGRESLVVARVLDTLATAHLIDPTASGARWRMHDLVRLYATEQTSSIDPRTRDQAVHRLLEYYLHLAYAADRHLRALPGMVTPDEFANQADALRWFDAERPTLVAAAGQAAAVGRDLIAADLPNHLAEYLDRRRHLDDKIITENISLNAARRLRDRRREGNALNNLGVGYIKLRRFDDAIAACTQAVRLHKGFLGFEGRGNALNTLGIALRNARRFDEAIAAHQQASRIFRRIRDDHSRGMALNNLGNDLQEVRRFDEAIAAHREAMLIYRRSGDRHREGRAWGNLGVVLRNVRRFEEAVAAGITAVTVYREVGDLHGEGEALINVGAVLNDMERFKEAVPLLESAIAIHREVNDRHREALARTTLGAALTGSGRPQEGIAAHLAAVKMFQETGDPHGEGTAVNNLGVALQQVQQFDDAIAAHQQAATFFRNAGDCRFEGAAILGLGLGLYKTGRLEQAIAAHETAVSIFREIGDRHAEDQAVHSLAALRMAPPET